MKYVPPGTFTMGSAASEPGREPDEAARLVTLTQGYYIMEHEVTVAQWVRIMGITTSTTTCGTNCPVEWVSWDDAVSFAALLSIREGRTYRLPTEAEWEHAARGDAPGPYAGSVSADQVAWHAGNSGGAPHPVCQLQRNSLGLCDMSGNVFEWVADGYGPYPAGPATDPEGAPDSATTKVYRGGSWSFSDRYCRAAYRDNDAPEIQRVELGFRLVTSATSPGN